MRYILYDKDTGEILHTHQSFKFGNDEPQNATENEIRLIVGRFDEADKLDLTKTTAPQVSSMQAEMAVDVKTGEVVVKQLRADALSRRLAELDSKETTKED
jgi:hypothetical protein